MKIIKLSSENVKRLVAVEITPDGTFVNIGGKNGAGKSSVLDSVAYALGGEKLVPPEPIRLGEKEAKIVVDLGEFIVTRRFTREQFTCNCKEGTEAAERGSSTPVEHAVDCHSRLLGETKSTIAVTNREGAKYPSPQKILDGLFNKLVLDPFAFYNEEPKKQNEILRQITSLDFTIINEQRKAASDRRLMHKKTLAIAESKLGELLQYTGVPAELVSIEEISTEIKEGQRLQREAEIRVQAVNTVQNVIEGLQKQRTGHASTIAEITKQIEALQGRLREQDSLQAECDIAIDERTKEAESLVTVADEAKKAVPNFETLDARLREIDATNQKVRANEKRAEQAKEIKRLEGLVADEDKKVKQADATKEAALQAAKFPVPGLGLSDDGVTFNDIPLKQASSSEQIRISTAIAMALNPTLRILLIRNGNLMDEDTLKLLGTLAEEAKAQVWIEFVTSSGVVGETTMSVMLEDGHIK